MTDAQGPSIWTPRGQDHLREDSWYAARLPEPFGEEVSRNKFARAIARTIADRVTRTSHGIGESSGPTTTHQFRHDTFLAEALESVEYCAASSGLGHQRLVRCVASLPHSILLPHVSFASPELRAPQLLAIERHRIAGGHRRLLWVCR
jgi:hypothetical protein